MTRVDMDNRSKPSKKGGKPKTTSNVAISCRNKTGVTGVSQVKPSGKFRANLMHEGTNYHLGTFSTIEEASQARKTAEDRVQNGLPPRAQTPPGRQAVNRTISHRNKTGVTGVSRVKRSERFTANIMVNREPYYLGTFPTMEEAIQARKIAEERIQQGQPPK